MHDVTKPYMGKRYKVQDRPMNFNVIEYKNFIETLSDSTLPLTYKKILLVGFWCNIKAEKP